MNRDRCVRNDIDMAKRPFFIIITGANMAGKSTYLRTVGINYLLGCIALPSVPAKWKYARPGSSPACAPRIR